MRRGDIMQEQTKKYCLIKASEDDLKELIEDIKAACFDVKAIYEELHRVQTPEPDVWRTVDSCISLLDHFIQRAVRNLTRYPLYREAEHWPYF